MTRRRDLVTAILHRARFLSRHALDLHLLTAEQERQPDVSGIPLRGAALCAIYLRVAEGVRADLDHLLALDQARRARREKRLHRREAKRHARKVIKFKRTTA